MGGDDKARRQSGRSFRQNDGIKRQRKSEEGMRARSIKGRGGCSLFQPFHAADMDLCRVSARRSRSQREATFEVRLLKTAGRAADGRTRKHCEPSTRRRLETSQSSASEGERWRFREVTETAAATRLQRAFQACNWHHESLHSSCSLSETEIHSCISIYNKSLENLEMEYFAVNHIKSLTETQGFEVLLLFILLLY